MTSISIYLSISFTFSFFIYFSPPPQGPHIYDQTIGSVYIPKVLNDVYLYLFIDLFYIWHFIASWMFNAMAPVGITQPLMFADSRLNNCLLHPNNELNV